MVSNELVLALHLSRTFIPIEHAELPKHDYLDISHYF